MKEITTLFIDDEENILNSIRRLFADESYGVSVVHNTAAAMDLLA